MDIRVDRNLETYKCYTFLEMGNDEGYDYKVNLRISFTPKSVIESLCYVICNTRDRDLLFPNFWFLT